MHKDKIKKIVAPDFPTLMTWIILLISNLIFIIYWSNLTIIRYESMHADVYDLGVAMEQGWLVFHTHWTVKLFFLDFGPFSGRIILSPLFIFKSFKLMLIAQAIAMSISSIFIYCISVTILKNKLSGIAFAIAFLIYPMTNSIFFDFHYMIFFIPFFLLGFYLYLKGMYILSILLLSIAGLMKFPFLIFPIIVYALGILEQLHMKLVRKLPIIKKIWFMDMVGILIFLLLLIIMYISIKSNLSGYIHASSSLNNTLYENFNYKIITIIVIFGTALFLPVQSKYILLFLPFLIIMFLFYPFAVYPALFLSQYNTLIFPFIFIASIDGLNNLFKIKDKSGSNKEIRIMPKKINKLAIIFLTVIVIMMPVFDIYGPYNNMIQNDFSINSLSQNTTMFEDMEKAVSFIPKNVSASDILVENDVPLIFPRYDSYGLNVSTNLAAPLEINAVGSFFYNYTIIGPHSQYYEINPEYIVMFPYGHASIANRFGYGNYIADEGAYPHNVSSFLLIEHLLSVHRYGILSEADGLYILEEGYTGDMKYYVPFYRTYNSDIFSLCSNDLEQNGYITIINKNNVQMVSGPPTALNPGNYSVTFTFTAQNVTDNSMISLQVLKNWYGITTYANARLNISQLSYVNKLYSYTLNINIANFTAGINFSVYINHLDGSLQFHSVKVYEYQMPPQRMY